jgi:SAM-dependent methyltransferase
MDESLISRLFENLPRQGPGSSACTQTMFGLVTGLPNHPRILDIGCGTGMQTRDLARLCPDAEITAVDVHQPFLDELVREAEKIGVDDRIRTLRASMNDLPFPPASFDLIWAEGSIFIMGLEQGLTSWKKFLAPGGSLAFTEAVWFTRAPSEEPLAFWNAVYPDIKTPDQIKTLAEQIGYSCIEDFPLPPSAWWDDYYILMRARLPALELQYRNNPEAETHLGIMNQEIELFEKYFREYGYQFFLLRNRK